MRRPYLASGRSRFALAAFAALSGCANDDGPRNVDTPDVSAAIATDSMMDERVQEEVPDSSVTAVPSLVAVREFTVPGGWSEPSLVVEAAGRVVVFDRGKMSLHLLDRLSGAELLRTGREGDGPGEFRIPAGIFSARSGFSVWDIGRKALEEFDSTGAYRGGSALPSFSVRVLSFRSGERIMQSMSGETLLQRSSGADAVPLVAVDSFAMESTSRCIDVRTNGELLMVLRCSAPEIAVFRTDGTMQQRHRLGTPVRARGEGELDRLRERFAKRMVTDGLPEELAAKTAAGIVDNYQVPRIFSRPVLLPDGALIFLEQLEDELDPASAVLHVIPPNGGSPARIDLPWRMIDISAGTDGTILMISEDPETGERRVASFRMQSVRGW